MSNDNLNGALARAATFLDTMPDSGMIDETSAFTVDDFRLIIETVDPREVSPAIPRHDLNQAAPHSVLFRYSSWKTE